MDEVSRNERIEKLSTYFRERNDIEFSVLFGSIARKTEQPQSDIDVGIYFYPASGELEIEDEVYYESEDSIWADIESLAGGEADLLVMNRAPSRIVYTALTEGISLFIADGKLRLRVIQACGNIFEEYTRFSESFYAVKARSLSLSDTDRDRLLSFAAPDDQSAKNT